MFVFHGLSPEVRVLMLDEIETDKLVKHPIGGKRLNDKGKSVYPELLREAFGNHDERWLAHEIRKRGLLIFREEKKLGGKIIKASVPTTAADTLAESDFNRFYCRGVCRLVLETDEEGVVEVYRAKTVDHEQQSPRWSVGRKYPAKDVLKNLRVHPELIPDDGTPGGPNSGMSVKAVEIH